MSQDIENKRARAELDRAAAELDDFTIARLRAARKNALASASQRPLQRFGWLPLAAAAALTAVVVTTLWWQSPEPTELAAEELEWSLVRDDPDFFTDLEFYDWLRHEQDAG
jgi:hypothetical protein